MRSPRQALPSFRFEMAFLPLPVSSGRVAAGCVKIACLTQELIAG